MKATSGLFAFLLILWMSGSTWLYVCKIKDHCKEVISDVSENTVAENTVSVDLINEQDLSDEIETIEQTKENIIEDMKGKISEGYIIYDFPENSIENKNIEASFDEFAENLKIYLDENTSEKIEIIGHTDDIGSEKANNKFGMKRAQFIKKKLQMVGINDNQMVISSKGKKEPVSSNKTDEGRKKNRRVVIKLISN